MAVAAVAVAVLALLFTVGSFWWLNARRGEIEATAPRAYAYGANDRLLRVRFPFAFFNTGATALLVADLRLVLDDEPGGPSLRWVTTRDRLRPEPDDGFMYPTPFSVTGRGTHEVIAEFEPSPALAQWSPSADRTPLRLQVLIHPSPEWVDVVTFNWWPPPVQARSHYIAHRNEARQPVTSS